MRVVFFGTPEFAAEYLRALIADSEIDVVAVVTQPDEPVGRKKVLTAPSTKVVAAAHGIPVLQPTKLKDPAFERALRAYGADAFVVIAYGRIIPQTVLDIPPLGCVNVHPSLLPKLRGPSPIIAAIETGARETGVTIMKLDAEMDHGPILAQTTIALAPDETTPSLTKKIVSHGVPLLIETLKQYAAGSITPKEQDHDAATFCTLLTREHGRIDWHAPAEVIDAKIRAYHPWPGTFTTWKRANDELGLKIFRASITADHLAPGLVHVQSGRIKVGTGTTALEILELQPAAGKRIDAKAFLQGHHDIDGSTLGA